jgi:serine/threonine protein kinase
MVFKVQEQGLNFFQALKIARNKLFDKKLIDKEVAKSLSPVPEQEILSLKELSHSYIVRFFDVIEYENKAIGLLTSYIENPKPLNLFIHDTLQKPPKYTRSYSISRLEYACQFLLLKFSQVASAINHMHEHEIYHFDIKPANLLISDNDEIALTDLGASVTIKLKITFTVTYMIYITC